MRGDGRLYREAGSRYWWCAYYVHGKEVRQSTRETDERRAKRVLRRHMADVLRGECIPHEHRVTLGDLVAMVRADYDVHQRRSRTTVNYPLKHLTTQLGAETPALALTSDRLDQYILDRRAEGASNASIRIELAMLSKGFTLAVRARKLRIKPYIPKPEGDPSRIREGFFTRDEVDRLCAHLPDVLADVVRFLFCSAWRVGEVRTLEWRNYDRTEGAIRLRPERSKTKRGRVLPLVGELAAIIARRPAHRDGVQRAPHAVDAEAVPHHCPRRPACCGSEGRYLQRRVVGHGRGTHQRNTERTRRVVALWAGVAELAERQMFRMAEEKEWSRRESNPRPLECHARSGCSQRARRCASGAKPGPSRCCRRRSRTVVYRRTRTEPAQVGATALPPLLRESPFARPDLLE